MGVLNINSLHPLYEGNISILLVLHTKWSTVSNLMNKLSMCLASMKPPQALWIVPIVLRILLNVFSSKNCNDQLTQVHCWWRVTCGQVADQHLARWQPPDLHRHLQESGEPHLAWPVREECQDSAYLSFIPTTPPQIEVCSEIFHSTFSSTTLN